MTSLRLDPIQGVLAVLDEGSVTGSNKFGLLLALIDLAPQLEPDGILEVDDLAEKLIEIHWDHALPFHGTSPLRQVASGNRTNSTLINAIAGLQEDLPAGTPFETARLTVAEPAWRRAISAVAKDTLRNPVTRLQNLPGSPEPFLYEFATGRRQLCLFPEAVDALVRFGPVLRDLVQFRFVRFVAQINQDVLGASVEDDLSRHLFGAERHMPGQAMRRDLWDLQGGRCLYTLVSVPAPGSSTRGSALDHVIPWARVRLSVTENFLVTSVSTNSRKRDLLLAPQLVERWVEHLTAHQQDIHAVSGRYGWPADSKRTGALASALYWGASAAAPTWNADGTITALGAAGKQSALTALRTLT